MIKEWTKWLHDANHQQRATKSLQNYEKQQQNSWLQIAEKCNKRTDATSRGLKQQFVSHVFETTPHAGMKEGQEGCSIQVALIVLLKLSVFQWLFESFWIPCHLERILYQRSYQYEDKQILVNMTTNICLTYCSYLCSVTYWVQHLNHSYLSVHVF